MRRIGIDVGGTNTDAVLLEDGLVVHAVKTPTTGDVTGGILSALGLLRRDPRVAAGAVDGVVVSKPIAMNTTRLSGFCRAIFSESSGEYTIRMSVPAALASKNDPPLPGTRIMSPNEVMITSGCEARWIASSTRPIGITHTGQPGPCTRVIDSGR